MVSKHSKNSSEIAQVISITTEKELAQEFQNFYKYLMDIDWNKRNDHLKRLSALIRGGAMEIDNFYSYILKLVPGLTFQLNDLRSSISKEAGNIICLMAETACEQLEPIADKLMTKDSLFKLINNATKILNEVGHQCICSLIQNVKSIKFIPKIIDEISSKNNSVRAKCAVYLEMIVENYSVTNLEKSTVLIENSIEKLISDANSETRNHARLAFIQYELIFPQKATKLFSKLDIATQKAINEEKNSYEKSNKSQNSREQNSLIENQIKKENLLKNVKNNGKTFDFSNQIRNKSSHHKTNDSLQGNSVLSYEEETKNEISKNKTKKIEPALHLKQSQQIKTKNNNFMEESESNQIPVQKIKKNILTSLNEKDKTKPVGAELKKKDSFPKKTIKNEEKMEIEEQINTDQEELHSILEKTEHPNWSLRASAFDKFSELFSILHDSSEIIDDTILDRIIIAHINHLLDPHFKVVQSCLTSMIKLTTYYSERIYLYMDELLINLLANLGDSKDKVYSKANILINLLEKLFSGDDLIGPLFKTLENINKIKIKICCLEAMFLVIKNCETYFNSYSNVKNFVTKISNLITENLQSKQILLPCFGVLVQIREKNFLMTMNSIIALTPNLLSNLRVIACQIAPDLEENIREHIMKSMKEAKKEYISRSKPPSNQEIQYETNKMMIEEKIPVYQQIRENNEQLKKIEIQNNDNEENIIFQTKEINNTRKKSFNEYEDIRKIETILKDLKGNNEIIINEINSIIVNLVKSIEFSKFQENAFKLLKKLCVSFDNFHKIVPDTICKILNLYHLNFQQSAQLDDIFEVFIPKINRIIIIKALLDKLASEKSPYLQIIIKWVSFVVRNAEVDEIRPFLDHLIDIFKTAINDTSPDVRKSVVFCLVDLNFLFENEIQPYLQMFHPNQQKLIAIYIKRRAEK